MKLKLILEKYNFVVLISDCIIFFVITRKQDDLHFTRSCMSYWTVYHNNWGLSLPNTLKCGPLIFLFIDTWNTEGYRSASPRGPGALLGLGNNSSLQPSLTGPGALLGLENNSSLQPSSMAKVDFHCKIHITVWKHLSLSFHWSRCASETLYFECSRVTVQ